MPEFIRSVSNSSWTCVLLLTFAAAAARATEPYTIPGHWVATDDDDEPPIASFAFEDLSFSPEGDGWIVGNPAFLHVRNKNLEITFVGPSVCSSGWFTTAAVPSRDEAWAGGFMHERDGRELETRALMWRYRNGTWNTVDLPTTAIKGRVITHIRFADRSDGWAIASTSQPSSTIALRYDGVAWSTATMRHSDLPWRIYDFCIEPSKTGWAVGIEGPERWKTRGVVLALRGNAWEEVPLPNLPEGGIELSSVACLANGGAIVAGSVYAGGVPTVVDTILLRYDGAWTRLTLPNHLSRLSLGGIAALGPNDFWIGGSCLRRSRENCDSAFIHFLNDQWLAVPAAELPFDRVPQYTISAIRFVSEDEGWAIATDWIGGGESKGLIFRYGDGAWQLANWNWHFWDDLLGVIQGH